MLYLVFLIGLSVGNVIAKKTHVVVVDGATVAADVTHEGTILVVKDGDSMDVRKVRENRETIKVAVVQPGPLNFHKDIWGDMTVDCKTCMEDQVLPAQESVWTSAISAPGAKEDR